MINPHEIAHLFDVPPELVGRPDCAACGRPFRPTYDVNAPGPTSRHIYRPVETVVRHEALQDLVPVIPPEALQDLKPAVPHEALQDIEPGPLSVIYAALRDALIRDRPIVAMVPHPVAKRCPCGPGEFCDLCDYGRWLAAQLPGIPGPEGGG